MRKHLFFNDYSEGAHPAVLELLGRTNLDQEPGYGEDSLCRRAAARIGELTGCPADAVHFIPGGTQANQIALAAMLRPYESVIAAESAHINVHEAGAIEATGHKINTVASADGKVTAAQAREVVARHTDEHMVRPRAVFVSQSTEVGTVYARQELEALSAACRELGLYLYLDGARLGSALTSARADLGLADLARLVDMLYIGGTKNGALIGEAMVIANPALRDHFRHHLKQRGALLAKGRIMGSQFLALFRDGLYFDLARHANAMAAALASGIRDLGFAFLAPPETNQIFPVFPDALVARLGELYGFYVWSRAGAGLSVVRLVTSWATEERRVREFLEDLRRLRSS